MYREQMNNISW